MSQTPELVYFHVRGFAELPRLLMAALGIQFKEVDLVTRDEFLAIIPDLLFEQVPLLRMDGLNIIQSNAIIRHIARKGGLLGKDPLEETRITMLYEGTRDFGRYFMALGRSDSDEDGKKAITDKAFPRYMPVFNKALKDNSDHTHLVGSSPTLADYALLEVLLAAVENFGADVFTPYPEIKNFYETLVSKENIILYIKEIRKPPNTKDSIAEVHKILNIS